MGPYTVCKKCGWWEYDARKGLCCRKCGVGLPAGSRKTTGGTPAKNPSDWFTIAKGQRGSTWQGWKSWAEPWPTPAEAVDKAVISKLLQICKDGGQALPAELESLANKAVGADEKTDKELEQQCW